MHTVVIFAADADTRTVNFRKPVDIVKLNAKLVLYPFAHFLAPAFRTDNALFKADLVFYPTFFDLLRKKQRI